MYPIIASFNKLIEDMPLNRALNCYKPEIAGALTKSKKIDCRHCNFHRKSTFSL